MNVYKVLAEFIVNIVSSLYNTVGHLYNFMSDMLTGTMVGSGIITSITSTLSHSISSINSIKQIYTIHNLTKGFFIYL